jgi:hypothetical protein
VATDVLTDRALNRATLERQLLLRRRPLRPVDAVAHLVGLQAQNPLDPYLALWSRLDGFDPEALSQRIEDRSLVRIVVMRGTIHLVTADDALVLRPLHQPVMDAEIARHRDYAPWLVGVDVGPALAFARAKLSDEPLNGAQLRAVLAERFPTMHAGALAYACRCLLPLVQVPPRGLWRRNGQVRSTPLETWVGRPMASSPSMDDVVLRYLAAFGPATTGDVTTWSRRTGVRAVLDRLRPRLRVFRDERNRELFDLPDAPRPDPDVAAPVRFLPEYDNVLLAHADRSRFGSDDERRFRQAHGPFKGSVLVDGHVRGIWHVEHDPRASSATVVVEHLALTRRAAAAVGNEAGRVARFRHPEVADHDARLIALE